MFAGLVDLGGSGWGGATSDGGGGGVGGGSGGGVGAEARKQAVASGRGEILSSLLYAVHMIAAYLAMMIAMTYQVVCVWVDGGGR